MWNVAWTINRPLHVSLTDQFTASSLRRYLVVVTYFAVLQYCTLPSIPPHTMESYKSHAIG